MVDPRPTGNAARPGQLFRPVRSHQQACGYILRPARIHHLTLYSTNAWKIYKPDFWPRRRCVLTKTSAIYCMQYDARIYLLSY